MKDGDCSKNRDTVGRVEAASQQRGLAQAIEIEPVREWIDRVIVTALAKEYIQVHQTDCPSVIVVRQSGHTDAD